MALVMTSTAFSQNGAIPRKYSCEGADISPDLRWSGVPSGAKSMVLIMDDPDDTDSVTGAKMTWVHWVLYNIPPTVDGLSEGAGNTVHPEGTEGKNNWNRTGYRGPCPPTGQHRYVHKLYALDIFLPDLNKPTAAQLEEAMQGHILEKAELIGTYQKQK